MENFDSKAARFRDKSPKLAILQELIVLRSVERQWSKYRRHADMADKLFVYFYSLGYRKAYRVDKQRIKEVGPDRACAEWLMRNGAFVKWSDSNKLTTDYNELPPEGERHFIAEVDGTDASITFMGFPHFEGCNHIQRVRFHGCSYLDDAAMQNMAYLKNTLKHLEISSNGNISDTGVKSLGILSKLSSLLLFDLMAVKDKDACVAYLNKSLPNCAVDFK